MADWSVPVHNMSNGGGGPYVGIVARAEEENARMVASKMAALLIPIRGYGLFLNERVISILRFFGIAAS